MSRMSKDTNTLFFQTSVAALTALLSLTACDSGQTDGTLESCEKMFGRGACEVSPQDRDKPVMMTDRNRPSYADLAACEAKFGPGQCDQRPNQGGGGGSAIVYVPQFIPGQTYYYPYSSGGYYGGSRSAVPPASVITPQRFTPTPAAQQSYVARTGKPVPQASMSNSTSQPSATQRGGFGSTSKSVSGGGSSGGSSGG